jgi:hypothetical protein
MKKLLITLLIFVAAPADANHHWKTILKNKSGDEVQIDINSVAPDRPTHLHLWDRHYDTNSGKILSLEQVDILCNRKIVRVNYSMDYVRNKEETYLDPLTFFQDRYTSLWLISIVLNKLDLPSLTKPGKQILITLQVATMRPTIDA